MCPPAALKGKRLHKNYAWLVIGLALLWLLTVAGGLTAFVWLEPSGSGFTRGSNRIAAFLGWQIAALALASITFAMGRRVHATGRIRRISRIPLWLSGGFFLLLTLLTLGVFAYTWLSGT